MKLPQRNSHREVNLYNEFLQEWDYAILIIKQERKFKIYS